MTRSSVSYAGVALAVAGALWFAAACKSSTSNNCGNGSSAPSLVGSYSLLSYTLGTTTVTSPTATGQLLFYPSAYHVSLTLPSGFVTDSGSYAVVGASCIDEFSVLGNPDFSGSFQLNLTDSTFHVSGTAAGQVAASLWKKTS